MINKLTAVRLRILTSLTFNRLTYKQKYIFEYLFVEHSAYSIIVFFQ
jgi:hypothetical protein